MEQKQLKQFKLKIIVFSMSSFLQIILKNYLAQQYYKLLQKFLIKI